MMIKLVNNNNNGNTNNIKIVYSFGKINQGQAFTTFKSLLPCEQIMLIKSIRTIIIRP